MDQDGLQKELEWRGRVPISVRFDDPYYSFDDGLEEARHVFLAGNDLAERLCDGFHVAELGFGTGLNALATAHLWKGPGEIRFTSFEAFPIPADAMKDALERWPELTPERLWAPWSRGARQIRIGAVALEVIEGDVRQTLAQWDGAADAWFLDGFSPAKNPEMWEPGVMAEVAAHTRGGGTFATYTAASHVRAALSAAGFAVERRAGFGRKRHMSAGRL